jgi:gamma-glutamyltranspeptidase/glutathione hydrolase
MCSAAYRSAAKAILALLLPVILAASPPAEVGERGMVVTPDEAATAVGLEVLRSGGNAVDGAVAVAFALAVTFPQAGSIGGGGLALLRTADGRYHALDYRELAPAALTAEMFLDDGGRPVEGRSLEGGLAVGVPGVVAGLAEMHRKWGSRPWAELLAPAIRLAEEGFAVSPYMVRSLARHAGKLSTDPEAGRIFQREGRFIEAGELLAQKDLASTLRSIAEKGASAFYSGPTAMAVVRSVRGAGGVMKEEDIAAYRPAWREPLVGSYRGYRVVTFPPPSSGGVALLQMLGMLERFDLRATGFGSSETIHLVAEVERVAFADRARWLGDPDFFEVPVAELLHPRYLAGRAASIRPDRATPSSEVSPMQPRASESHDTLHFSIADGEGRVVSCTTTLNTSFGNGMVARGTGILLNNEMDDFALAPGAPNTFGLLGGEANAVAGGKRPLSSMTPTIVERPGGGKRPVLVLGSPGGPTIITSVLQVLVNVIDHGMPLQEAVNAPRFHHQWLPDLIEHEKRAFPADVARNLKARGHAVKPSDGIIGNVNAIGLDREGHWLGAADPRREGSAAGF